MVILDDYFTLSDAELLAEIREITLAMTSSEQSASSKDVGSYTLRSTSDLARERDRMTRCYAARVGACLSPRRGITMRKVVVRKDYFEAPE